VPDRDYKIIFVLRRNRPKNPNQGSRANSQLFGTNHLEALALLQKLLACTTRKNPCLRMIDHKDFCAYLERHAQGLTNLTSNENYEPPSTTA
jgi:hypothetical protein